MTALDQVTLESIAQAVADELQLSVDESVSVSQVTIAITFDTHRHDWLDDWYEKYASRHDEVPF